MSIIIASGITDNYLEKAKPFLQSLDRIVDYLDQFELKYKSKIDIMKHVITLDFEVSQLIKNLYPTIYFGSVSSEKFKDELTYIHCLQHGRFVDYLSPVVADEDIVVYCDADIIIQRAITDSELDLLEDLKHGDICVGINNHYDKYLVSEYQRLEPRCEMNEIAKHFDLTNDELNSFKVFNTGVIAATVATWENLKLAYRNEFLFIDSALGHYAKQQWLISLIIQANKEFKIKLMPQRMHTHGHFDLPPFAELTKDDILTFDGEPVLFRHKI